MIIPLNQLAPDTLQNIIEAFVLREGTDYGEQEVSFADKVRDVEQQLRCGEAVLVWSEQTQSINILPNKHVPKEHKDE